MHGLIRVLHDASFLDDPTRILRALRYAARLGFALEPRPSDCSRAAAQGGALRTVSGPRVRDELLRPARRARGARGGRADARPGRGGRAAPALRADPELVASARRWARWRPARTRALAALAALCSDAPGGREPSSSGSTWALRPRDAVLRAARQRPASWRETLREPLRPSELHALLAPEPPEALALALGAGRARGAGGSLPGRPATRPARDRRRATCSPPGCRSRPRSAGR